MSENLKHTLSIYVTNKPGVLVRVAQVFSRRGYNIDSLVVSPDIEGSCSRMTITAAGPQDVLEQIIKQVSKLVDVLHAVEHSHQEVLEKELALIKVLATGKTRPEILQLVEHFKAQTVDFTDESVVIQVTGNTEKLNAFINLLVKFKIQEIVRTGKILVARGKEPT